MTSLASRGTSAHPVLEQATTMMPNGSHRLGANSAMLLSISIPMIPKYETNAFLDRQEQLFGLYYLVYTMNARSM
jgi:hypothetical protein